MKSNKLKLKFLKEKHIYLQISCFKSYKKIKILQNKSYLIVKWKEKIQKQQTKWIISIIKFFTVHRKKLLFLDIADDLRELLLLFVLLFIAASIPHFHPYSISIFFCFISFLLALILFMAECNDWNGYKRISNQKNKKTERIHFE